MGFVFVVKNNKTIVFQLKYRKVLRWLSEDPISQGQRSDIYRGSSYNPYPGDLLSYII